MRKVLYILILFAFTISLSNAQVAKIQYLENLPYDKYELEDAEDNLTFYLSLNSSKQQLPLVVFVQGSGMNSLFSKAESGRIRSEYGHSSLYDICEEKFRVLIVEKPGVQYLQTGHSKLFDLKFSLESWVETIVKAINYTLENEPIAKDKVLVIGHSEGGLLASRVARLLNDKVSNVAILAGEGPTQLYSLYKFAADGTFFNREEHNMPSAAERLAYLKNTWKQIQSYPSNTEKKFMGFTYLRWSSMLSTSVMEELVHFDKKILLVQGTDDKNVHPETAIISFTTLLSKGKAVQLEMIENADHSFTISENSSLDGWNLTLTKVIDWFLHE